MDKRMAKEMQAAADSGYSQRGMIYSFEYILQNGYDYVIMRTLNAEDKGKRVKAIVRWRDDYETIEVTKIVERDGPNGSKYLDFEINDRVPFGFGVRAWRYE